MNKRIFFASLCTALITLNMVNVSSADNSSKKNESNSLSNQIVANKWISPISATNVKAGSELSIKLNFTTSSINTVAVTGLAGKKSFALGSNLIAGSLSVFPGQIIEFPNAADSTVLPTGTKVVKISGSAIYLSAALTRNFSGNVKISGLGLIDNKQFVQVFAAPCQTSSVQPVLISPIVSAQKSNDGDKDGSGESSERGNSVLSFKWKIAKNQTLGCYNLYARYITGPVLTSSGLTVSPTDYKNPAAINILARNRS